ncbi:hypothetical protein SMACR_07519 [Sordaria macrospora]|uniref:WGS project CABT00000000 data, contig 2.7 n=2 Tax=Sordaria macrospora TaxID=5147 RepID=F7VTP4_SORMK|nr:uncharacterized protein SMAC_07519 [Sordaria macrospora k-hell]KAA8634488.1 hypothetical protein SMACR_07519 [Sordaria macrospora]KAH7632641.1 hypothetical protein B0T09DRAFT_299893 [Sordaria sp. MPI-SDFR-AT-0083]WPJ60873.1 hypothetical protein SMAC4_07519 [Sordaria macrospora]CCC08882.1 unnamed protein product [Sordaria macrospora k-hell]
MSTENNSTLKSYIDSATGAVQNAVGNIMGNRGDQAEGELKKEKAHAEHAASHDTAKLPGFTATTDGAVAADHPDRASGSWKQTAGAAKEFVGGTIGSEELKQAGRQQNREGQEQEARGQVKDLGEGAKDRFTGQLGNAAAALVGDREKEAEYQAQHDVGKAQQRGAEHDISKEAEAQKRTSDL